MVGVLGCDVDIWNISVGFEVQDIRVFGWDVGR